MLEIPTESDLGSRDVSALRVRFEVKNSFDYGLYNEAKRLSEIRVAKCAKGNPVIAKLRAETLDVKPETSSNDQKRREKRTPRFGARSFGLCCAAMLLSGRFCFRPFRGLPRFRSYSTPSLQIEFLNGSFGALIQNITAMDLENPELCQMLRRTWLQAGLLVMRGLTDLTPDSFASFSRHFGPLGPVPAGREHAKLGPGGCILRIGNVRDGTGKLISQPSSTKENVLAHDGSCQYRPAERLPVWHTDGTFKETPEAGTALYCRQAPVVGGATCFSDAAAAWESLDTEKQQHLLKMDCICSLAHHDAKLRKRNPDYPMLTDAERRRNPPRRVPLSLKHPETGKRAIYGINSSTCFVIAQNQEVDPGKLEWHELTGEEDDSVSVLQELLVHATSPKYTVSWQWQAGDLAICDTRSTMHCATSYNQEKYTREICNEPQAAPVVKEVKKAPVQATPLTVDEMFGCTNGSLEMVNGTYLLLCRELVGGEKHLEFFSSLDLRPADEGAT
eukprot:symbB.v1.2.026852.t2/scaffold2714.1/size94327/5